MLGAKYGENSIKAIASTMPLALVDAYGKQAVFSQEHVTTIFTRIFKSQNNIAYAYAMFCSEQEFKQIKFTTKGAMDYQTLRLAVSKDCFESWPRFNFDSLLTYANSAQATNDSGIIGVAGDTGGCDGGGC